MTQEFAAVLILLGCLGFGKLCGIRNQLSRIADVCESAERRAKARVDA